MARRGGLGKGLGALLPTAGPDALAGLQELPVASIEPNRYQPREHFDEEDLSLLANSIREVGVLQPILVRPQGSGYELIAGERRWRAARRVGLQTIPALVRETDDSAALEHAIVENIHRSNLNPLEEAAAYQQLIEDFQLTHDEVATRVGKGRATVSNMLRLLHLPPTVQRELRAGKLSMGHARALLGTPDRAFQEELSTQIIADGLSVRAAEELVRERSGGNSASGGNGDEHSAPTAPTILKLRPPGLLELEELLGDFLATRVQVSMGARKGRVTIDFSDLEDLERIYRQMTAPSSADG